MNNALEGLKQKGDRYFNETASRLLLFIQFQNPLEVLNKETLNQTKIKKFFSNIIHNIDVQEKFVLEDKLSALVDSADKK